MQTKIVNSFRKAATAFIVSAWMITANAQPPTATGGITNIRPAPANSMILEGLNPPINGGVFYFGRTNAGQVTDPVKKVVTEYGGGYYVEIWGDHFFHRPGNEWSESFSFNDIINTKYPGEKYYNGVWVSYWGSFYGKDTKMAVGFAECDQSTYAKVFDLNVPPHIDKFQNCAGADFPIKPDWQIMSGDNARLTDWGRIYSSSQNLAGRVSIGSVNRPLGGTTSLCTNNPTGNGAAYTYFAFWVGKATPNCVITYNKNKPANEPDRKFMGFYGGTEVGDRGEKNRTTFNGANINLANWTSAANGYKKYGYLVKKVSEADNQWELILVNNGTANYTFTGNNNEQYYVIPILERCGVKYCLDWNNVKISCENCLVESGTGTKYCFESNKITDFKGIKLEYVCSSNSYELYTIDNFGNKKIYLFPNGKIKNPDQLRPDCNTCGSMKDNFHAFKYLRPKQNPLSFSYDYVILPQEPIGANFSWRGIVSLQPGSTDFKIQTSPQSALNAENSWTTRESYGLGLNMANAPGTPSAVNLNNPIHQYRTFPSATCSGLWTNAVNLITSTWSEAATDGQYYICKTYNTPDVTIKVKKPGQTNLVDSFIGTVRTRVCDPCSINNFTGFTEGSYALKGKDEPAPANATEIGELKNAAGIVIGKVYTFITGSLTTCQLPTGAKKLFASSMPQSQLLSGCIDLAAQYSRTAMTKTAEKSLLNTAVIITENSSGVYPNPFSTQLTIRFTNAADKQATCSIADALGIIKYQSNAKNRVKGTTVNDVVNTENWPAGIYVLTIDYGNGEKLTKKIVKQ